MTVKWDAPCFTNGKLERYNVTLLKNSDRAHGDNWESNLSTPADTTDLTIAVLPYRNYTLYVQAINDYGSSENSPEATFQSPIAGRSDYLKYVSYVARGSILNECTKLH